MYKFPKIRMPLKGMPYLTFIVLFNTIVATSLVPIIPLFIKSFVQGNNALVGFTTAFIAGLLLIYSLLIRKVLSKTNKINLLRFGFLGLSITVALFIFLTTIKQFLILQIFRAFFTMAVGITIGLFVREYTTTKAIGRAEGMFFSVSNVGWLIGPLFGGLLAVSYSFNTIFLIVAVAQLIIAILLFTVPLKEKITKHVHRFKFLDYIKNKQLCYLYLLHFGLSGWWVVLYTFMPLFADTNGFSTKVIGFVMFGSAIPLIIFEYPVGKLADAKGFRKFMFFGFLLISIIAVSIYFVRPSIGLLLIALASFGAIFIEPLTEAYFFEEIRNKEKQESLYPIYRTSDFASHLVFPILLSTVLIGFGFKGLFLVAGILMIVFALIALNLKR